MVVRNGFSEKTTSEEIITLCTSSINITKLATVIKAEIVSKKKKKQKSEFTVRNATNQSFCYYFKRFRAVVLSWMHI